MSATECEKPIILSRVHLRELLQVRERIELKYKVVISVPPDSTSCPPELSTVGFSGLEKDVVSSMLFVNTYVHDVRPSFFVYPSTLSVIFSNDVWISLLEDLHDVLLINIQQKRTLLVIGARLGMVISELNDLATSLNRKANRVDESNILEMTERITNCSTVPPSLKCAVSYAVNSLPRSSLLILLPWTEQWLLKKQSCFDESSPIVEEDEVEEDEDEDQSVIILDAPVKNIPVVTISDDEDEPCTSTTNTDQKPDTSDLPSPPPPEVAEHSGSSELQSRTDNGSLLYIALEASTSSKRQKSDEHNKKKRRRVSPRQNTRTALVAEDQPSTSGVVQLCNGNRTLCMPLPQPDIIIDMPPRRLRPIVIDGNNIARTHGTPHEVYSCRGIKICIDYFLERGHEVTAFVPRFRGQVPKAGTADQHLLEELAVTQRVVFTPTRLVDGRPCNSYDDRFIIKLASERQGVIVSNDNFRDLMTVSETWKETIEKRLLMYCFVGDLLMFPDDPLGRHGPTLNEFLSFPSPYGM